MRALRIVLCTFLMVISCEPALAVETHARLWLASVFTGPISADHKIKFYIEPNLYFMDTKYKYQLTRVWLGLGYQPVASLVLYAGDAPEVTRDADGTYSHEHIVWQQVSWTSFESPHLKMVSRTRLEETKNVDESPWAIVLRERLQFKFPLAWEEYALVVSDELFFDLKNPAWSSSASFISQNRAYLGFDRKLTKIATLAVGYINQYQFTTPNQMSNVLQAALEFNFG